MKTLKTSTHVSFESFESFESFLSFMSRCREWRRVLNHMDSTKIITEQRLLYWAQFIRDRKASGLSVRAFCRNADVRENTYYYWQKKIRDEACEQLLMSQTDDGSASFVPKGFTEVVVHGDNDCEIIIHDTMPVAADLVPQTAIVATAPPYPIAAVAPPATPESSTSTESSGQHRVTEPTSFERRAAMETATGQNQTTEPIGQIQIDIRGIKVSADALYPMDQLTKVLKGLVRT
jgi:hypothetical protein